MRRGKGKRREGRRKGRGEGEGRMIKSVSREIPVIHL